MKVESTIVFFIVLIFVKTVKICKSWQTPETHNCYYHGGIHDAIIIGSGSSGLATALLLQKENITSTPLVLEGKPTSPSVPNDIYSIGGCIDTFRIPNGDSYLGEAMIGYHYLSFLEDNWVQEAFSETVGLPTEVDYFDQPQYYHVFSGWGTDGTDLVIEMETGFLTVTVPDGSRRSDGKYMCLNIDGVAYFSDECEDGQFKVNSRAEHLLSVSERKTKDFMNYHRNPKRFSKPDLTSRRYTEDTTTEIPKFVLSMIAAAPEYEEEVWNFIDYSFGIYYGYIDIDYEHTANEVINSFLTSPLHRHMMKVPAASAFMIVSESYYTPADLIGLIFYQYLSRAFWTPGGPETLKEQFVNQIKNNGGSIEIRKKVTKFVYDNTYRSFFFHKDPRKEYECPRVFTYSICIKRCLVDSNLGDAFMDLFHFDNDDSDLFSCLEKCYENKYACRGKRRVKGVIVNDDTFYETDLVVSTAGHYQNYKKLTPSDVVEEFGYDEAFETLKPGSKIFFFWSSHDGSPASYNIKNAEYFIYPHPDLDFGEIEQIIKTQTEFDESVVTPYFYASNNLRNVEFSNENPDLTVLSVLGSISQKVWEPFKDTQTHERPQAYYTLKEKYENFTMKIIEQAFGVVHDRQRIASATPLTQRDYMGYGYSLGGMSSSQDSPKSEDGIPQWHMKGVENIFIAGNDHMGPGIPVVINSARRTIRYIQERDEEAIY